MVTVKLAVVCPELMVTLPGTDAVEVLLDKATKIPPAGAGALSVTVPVDGLPPTSAAGFSATDASAIAGLIVSDAVWLAPL